MNTYLSVLLKNPVRDTTGANVGRLQDVIIQIGGDGPPPVTALVVAIGRTDIFVHASDIASLDGGVTLTTARLDVRPFNRRPGEVLMRQDVLGHRVVDIEAAEFLKAHDVELAPGDVIRAVGLDVQRRHLFRTDAPAARPWTDFKVLIGHDETEDLRRADSHLREMHPAEVADLIEDASTDERDELLTEVASDPDFEADVFEELDEDEVSRVLRDRDDVQIAASLAHMQTDDAADALLNLPQPRRQSVIDAIAEPKRGEILTLLSYQGSSAGGLMGNDQLALSDDTTAAAALEAVRTDTARQPQTLNVVFTLDADGRLAGAVPLVRLLQADPSVKLCDIHEDDPECVGPSDDVLEIVTRMADFNLLALPVVDAERKLVGVITVDDALEAAIPGNWRHR